MVQLIEKRNTHYMPLFVLGSVGLQLLILVILFLQAGALSRLSRQPPPTLVQMQDGEAIRVSAMGSKDRSPETIRRFVNDTLVLMFNWSGSLPATTAEEASQPKTDPGLPVEVEQGKRKVATASWQASFAFSEDFRQEFLQRVAELTPPDVFAGGTQVIIVVNHVSEPEIAGEGRWKVDMVSHLYVFNEANALGEAIPFNREVFVEAVTAPAVPAGKTALEEAIYSIRQAGLQIYAIRELEREELK
ncbi:MAG: hypothetical protein AAGF01_00155 [Cyanobacteria bacterium P01_G01_bin.38]